MGKVSMRCSGYFTHNGRVNRRHFQFLPAAALCGVLRGGLHVFAFFWRTGGRRGTERPDAQVAMTAGTLTSRTLTRSYLERIARIDDGGPMLNSVIEINPDAMEQAD